MSDQVEREGSNSIQFHNILAAALPVIKSKLFMNIDYGELDSYAEFVQYRVQRDLYELSEERAPGNISWEDFVLLMRSAEELRDVSRAVICRRMKEAFFDFDFTEKEIGLFRESDASAGDQPGGALLFSKAEGIILMGLLLYFAECAHFNRLQDTVRPGCRWEDYFHDLGHDSALWHTVLTGFRDAIQRLDFKTDRLEVRSDHGL